MFMNVNVFEVSMFVLYNPAKAFMVHMTIDMLQSLTSDQGSNLSHHWSYEIKKKATSPNQTFLEDKRYIIRIHILLHDIICSESISNYQI